jgi:rhodanese-related sulfurtransferase
MRIHGVVLAAAMLALGFPALAQSQTPVRTLSAEAFAKAPGEAILIDVREPREWAQTGTPAQAKRVSISRTDFVTAVLAEVGGDKTKPVALICRSGSRSVRAAEQLAAAGFTNITNVGDGMIGRDGVGKGWLAANLPLTRVETGE